jgi:hypothetical protein
VGANCVNYGINESRCLQCPFKDTGEDSEMVIDGDVPPIAPSSGMEEYEVGPAHHEDEDHRKENVVRKEDPVPIEKQKHHKDAEGEITNSVPKKPALDAMI